MIAQRATIQRPAFSAGRAPLIVRCSGNGASSAFHDGQRVKVVTSVKVYHAPKHHDGLDLNGLEGTLVKNVTQYKGKVLSANFPFEVEFILPADPKPLKFKAHLGEDEIQAL